MVRNCPPAVFADKRVKHSGILLSWTNPRSVYNLTYGCSTALKVPSSKTMSHSERACICLVVAKTVIPNFHHAKKVNVCQSKLVTSEWTPNTAKLQFSGGDDDNNSGSMAKTNCNHINGIIEKKFLAVMLLLVTAVYFCLAKPLGSLYIPDHPIIIFWSPKHLHSLPPPPPTHTHTHRHTHTQTHKKLTYKRKRPLARNGSPSHGFMVGNSLH